MKHEGLHLSQICGHLAYVILSTYDDLIQAGFNSEQAQSLIHDAFLFVLAEWRGERLDKSN